MEWIEGIVECSLDLSFPSEARLSGLSTVMYGHNLMHMHKITPMDTLG